MSSGCVRGLGQAARSGAHSVGLAASVRWMRRWCASGLAGSRRSARSSSRSASAASGFSASAPCASVSWYAHLRQRGLVANPCGSAHVCPQVRTLGDQVDRLVTSGVL